MLRIISLNLNGIRSAWSKNVLPWAAAQDANIICLQELKAQLPDLTAEMLSPDGMRASKALTMRGVISVCSVTVNLEKR